MDKELTADQHRHLQEAERVAAEAAELFGQQRYPEASPLFKRALQLAEAAVGRDHPALAHHVFNLGLLYEVQGKEELAREAFRRTLQVLEAHLGPDHTGLVDALWKLATQQHRREFFDEQGTCFNRIISILERRPGDEERLIEVLLDAGFAHYYWGRYVEAEPYYLRALELTEARLGPFHRLVACCSNKLAQLYNHGRVAKDPAPWYRREIAIREVTQGPNDPDVGEAAYRLAELHRRRGELAEATPLYLRAASIWEICGLTISEIDWMARGYREFLQETGRTAELAAFNERCRERSPIEFGRDYFQAELARREAVLEPNDPELADQYFAVANGLRFEKRYDEAEHHYLRALAVYEAAFDPNDSKVAEVLTQLGRMYSWMKRFADCEPLFDRALAIQAKAHGPQSLEVAVVMEDRADFELARDRLADGARWYQQAMAIYKTVHDPASYAWAETLWKYARFFERARCFDKAWAVCEQLRPLTEACVRRAGEALDFMAVITRVLFALGRLDEWPIQVDRINALRAERGDTHDYGSEWLTGAPRR
ncbi:MAG: tetratricopeptide repeat protein [Gemmataceae bacterium]